MARLKKPLHYIEELRSKAATQGLGQTLRRKYARWTRSLQLKDFLDFIEVIERNRDKIGAAQFFGKFRAYSFEEYVYRLIEAKVSLPESLRVYWGGRCLVWRDKGQEYCMEVDVAVGREAGGLVDPSVVVDAKMELDASRLKVALASFALIRRWNPKVKCFLVYVKKMVNRALLGLSKHWVDGIYNFSLEASEVQAFVRSVQEALIPRHQTKTK